MIHTWTVPKTHSHSEILPVSLYFYTSAANDKYHVRASLLHLSPFPYAKTVQRANQAAPSQPRISNISTRNSLFFSVRSLARHHVNDYVSLSDGPLTSSSSYSRLHAAVAKVRQTTRFWRNNSILDEWHHHSPILYIRLCVALWATGP